MPDIAPPYTDSRRRTILVSLLGALLFLIFTLVMVRWQIYLVWLIAPAILVFLLSIISIDRYYLLLLFLTPLSVQLRFLVPATPVDIFLPTELMLLLLLIIVLYKIVYSREFDRRNLKHPVTIVVLLSLLWMVITSLTGTDLLVSVKATLVRVWYIAAFYLLAMELFRNRHFREIALKALVFGMVPVVIYHIVKLSGVGFFNRQAAHVATWPFFNDHTSFGAALAFLIPVVVYLMITGKNIVVKSLYLGVGLLFLTGFIFSYSRAAWISLVLATLFASVFIFRIPWRLVGIVAIVSGLIVAMSWTKIMVELGSNRQDSSADMVEHVQSIANITSDASNLERINRWQAAIRMVAERPLFGRGPGTYQFQYAPYQLSHERTIISTNFGDGGNAHSEYLGAMVESGIPGTIFYIVILILALRSGFRIWRRRSISREGRLSLSVMAGLFTYIIHGGLNNFLDTDKIAAPFWIFIALLVVMDLESESPLSEE